MNARPSTVIRPRILVGLLVACATAQALRSVHEDRPAPPAPAATLPAALLGAAGRHLTASPGEAQLAAAGRVRIARRAYGPTQVAVLTLDDGVKELHPPAVCLRAAGFEIVGARDEPLGAGCARALRVRDGRGRTQHFYFAFVTAARAECSFASRTANRIWRQLVGRNRRELLLQVMDHDRTRARRAFAALLGALRAAPATALAHERS